MSTGTHGAPGSEPARGRSLAWPYLLAGVLALAALAGALLERRAAEAPRPAPGAAAARRGEALPAESIRIRVEDTEGRPVPRARVRVRDAQGASYVPAVEGTTDIATELAHVLVGGARVVVERLKRDWRVALRSEHPARQPGLEAGTQCAPTLERDVGTPRIAIRGVLEFQEATGQLANNRVAFHPQRIKQPEPGEKIARGISPLLGIGKRAVDYNQLAKQYRAAPSLKPGEKREEDKGLDRKRKALSMLQSQRTLQSEFGRNLPVDQEVMADHYPER